MVRALAVAWLLLLVTPPSISAEDRLPATFQPGPAVLRDRAVFDCFMHLLREAKYGYVDTERAAFLVLQPDGIHCVDWPATNDFKVAHWSGPKPAGVVAVAHTHPVRSPYPSPDDVLQAQRSGTPIFVLTPMMVHLIHADGHAEIIADSTKWTRYDDGDGIKAHVQVWPLRGGPGAR